jgi:hypothetical protein
MARGFVGSGNFTAATKGVRIDVGAKMRGVWR